jgi:hypothetical protein
MKKIVKLNEDDLKRIVSRVMSEQSGMLSYASLTPCKPGQSGTLVVQGNIMALSDGKPFCRIEAKPVAGGGGSKPTPSVGAAAGAKVGALAPKTGGM